MTILKFSKNPSNEPPFFKDIREDGYHIYSLNNANKPNFYPPEIPDYPGVNLSDLQEDDTITIRVFFGIGSGKKMRVDGGHVDLKIEVVEKDSAMGLICTELPKEFPLSKGESIEIYEDEILYKSESE